jgi:hypothetical protein
MTVCSPAVGPDAVLLQNRRRRYRPVRFGRSTSTPSRGVGDPPRLYFLGSGAASLRRGSATSSGHVSRLERLYDYALIKLDLGETPGWAFVLRDRLPEEGSQLEIAGRCWHVADARYGRWLGVIEGVVSCLPC